jgi:hypothetical protein
MSVSVKSSASADMPLWRTAMLVVSLPIVVGALLWGASVLGDHNRIPGLLALAAKESGVMYCTAGKIVHGVGSLLDRALEPGVFRCTEWKVRGEGSETVRGATPFPDSPRRLGS